MDIIVKDAFNVFPSTCADCPLCLCIVDKNFCLMPSTNGRMVELTDILPQKDRHPACRIRPIRGSLLYESDDGEKRAF